MKSTFEVGCACICIDFALAAKKVGRNPQILAEYLFGKVRQVFTANRRTVIIKFSRRALCKSTQVFGASWHKQTLASPARCRTTQRRWMHLKATELGGDLRSVTFHWENGKGHISRLRISRGQSTSYSSSVISRLSDAQLCSQRRFLQSAIEYVPTITDFSLTLVQIILSSLKQQIYLKLWEG